MYAYHNGIAPLKIDNPELSQLEKLDILGLQATLESIQVIFGWQIQLIMPTESEATYNKICKNEANHVCSHNFLCLQCVPVWNSGTVVLVLICSLFLVWMNNASQTCFKFDTNKSSVDTNKSSKSSSFDQLTNYCYQKKKVTENSVANSLAAWPTFDQLSWKLEDIGGVQCPHTPHQHITDLTWPKPM